MSLFSTKILRRCHLSAAVLVAVLLPAGLVTALGLGEITVNSQLNQPMDGEITLANLGNYEPEDIRVRLATLADFERSGVERLRFHSELKFEIVGGTKGNAIIKVTSKESVQEPYLDFVVEAYWPDGRVLREYTVLLDLPLYAAESVDTESFTQAKPTSKPITRAASKRLNPGLSGSSYTVGTDDTLWGIARQVKPSGSSIHQTMIAIQDKNPEAFRASNINQLHHGAILELPSAQEITGLNLQSAITEVKKQNEIWKEQPLTKVPLDASRSANTSTGGDKASSGHLSLASGGGSSSSAIGDQPASKASADLVAANEVLDVQRRENQELQSRMDELQEQMGTLQTLIELKDDQINQLRNNADTGSESEQEAVVKTDDFSNEGSSTATGESIVEPVDEGMAEPVVVEAKEKAKPVVFIDDPEESSIIDILLANLTYLLVGILLIALVVYAAMKRRVGVSNGEDESEINNSSDQDDDDEWNDFDEQVDNVVSPEESPVIAQAQELIDKGDTVKALSVLESAVGKEPHRSDVRLKHLQVLADSNMSKQFKIHYMGLKAIGNDEDIAKADAILAATPNSDEWLKEAEHSSISASEKYPEMDYDSVDDDLAKAEQDETGDLDLDDIADLDMSNISADDGEVDLDLDLEDFDSELSDDSSEVVGLDEDLDDDFSAELLATREGGEGLNDLPELDDLMGADDLDASLSVDEDTDLDDDISLDIDGSDDLLSLDDDGEDLLSLDEDNSAINDLSDEDDLDLDLDSDLDEDFDFDLSDEMDLDDVVDEEDEIATRLELARAYVELGDEGGAKEILNEVAVQGSDEQKAEAASLLESL